MSPKASAAAGGHRGAPGTAAAPQTRRGAAAAGAAGGAHAAHGHQLARRPAMGWGSGGEWWENGGKMVIFSTNLAAVGQR